MNQTHLFWLLTDWVLLDNSMSTGVLENPNKSEFSHNSYHNLHNTKHNNQCAYYMRYSAVSDTTLEAFLRYDQSRQNSINFFKPHGDPGSRITKPWNHQISWTFGAMKYGFRVPPSFLTSHAFRQRCCRVACHIWSETFILAPNPAGSRPGGEPS